MTDSHMHRGRRLAAIVLIILGGVMSSATSLLAQTSRVHTGAEELLLNGFAQLAGKRVGLITNQTGLVGTSHLADILADAPDVKLTAIYAPEHGFRGLAEAGAKVSNTVDKRTGVPVLSLYGKTRKPTRKMLRNIDVLVFDIQDIGVRFYTYISTMGLAMQAAAESGLPFIVLDRANPLGGNYVSGFTLERRHTSFVGQYPIPIAHGMTVGELARMIKGERWLRGLENLDLSVIKLRGWKRSMRWPTVSTNWVATSPNIPTFASALVYPGIGIIGDTAMNEGRGTPTPFELFGAPWMDARAMARHLNNQRLPGATFKATTYVPRSIPNVALNPLFKGRRVNGVRIIVDDVDRYQPLEVGIHALAKIFQQAKRRSGKSLFKDPAMFTLISGTRKLRRMLEAGQSGASIIAAWRNDVRRFRAQRAPYLLY